MYICSFDCMYVGMSKCMHVCMYVCMYVCTRVYVCMYVRTCVCLFVCMHCSMFTNIPPTYLTHSRKEGMSLPKRGTHTHLQYLYNNTRTSYNTDKIHNCTQYAMYTYIQHTSRTVSVYTILVPQIHTHTQPHKEVFWGVDQFFIQYHIFH